MIQNEQLRSKSTYDSQRRIVLCREHRRDVIHKTRWCAGRTKDKRHRWVGSKERFDEELDLIRSTSWEEEGSEAVITHQFYSVSIQSQRTNLMYNTLCLPKRVTAWSKNCIILKLSGLCAGSSKEPAHQRSGNTGLREFRLSIDKFIRVKQTYPT